MNETLTSRQRLLRSFWWTCAFCLAIAVLLWVLEVTGTFWHSASIAFTVGWSIFAAQTLLCPLLEGRVGMLAANVLATSTGLAVAIGLIILFVDRSYFNLSALDARAAAPILFFGVLGTVVFTNLTRLHETREALSKAELSQLSTERRLSEAKLKTLQAQIEPHFLFNTLSTAKGLIRTDPEAAEETLQQLTTLLRNSLGRTRETNTTLGEEIELVKAYLRIQKIRMGERLQFQIDCPAELSATPLSPLLVQPLVENALTHGLEPSETGGQVRVAVDHTEDEMLRITVSDTGLGLNQTTSQKRSGTGLANVRERLRALHGSTAELKLAPNTPNGLVATLLIPLT